MRTILIFLAIISMSGTCKKQSDDGGDWTSLEGRWMQSETLISPGPIGEWKAYKGPAAFLNIFDDGHVESEGATSIGNQYDSYVVNGNKVIFYKEGTTDSLRGSVSVDYKDLTVWFPCIEPCGTKLKRVKYIF